MQLLVVVSSGISAGEMSDLSQWYNFKWSSECKIIILGENKQRAALPETDLNVLFTGSQEMQHNPPFWRQFSAEHLRY